MRQSPAGNAKKGPPKPSRQYEKMPPPKSLVQTVLYSSTRATADIEQGEQEVEVGS